MPVTAGMSFNSRLREEATCCAPQNPPGSRCFNSRLREEATVRVARLQHFINRFNSRLREEATRLRLRNVCGEIVSTHASVRRRLSQGSTAHTANRSFNSRLREEATDRRAECSAVPGVSTHASVRRRPGVTAEKQRKMRFQLTPP